MHFMAANKHVTFSVFSFNYSNKRFKDNWIVQ